MDEEYTVRIGTRRGTEPADSYHELLSQPYEEADDDGAIAGPWLCTPGCGRAMEETLTRLKADAFDRQKGGEP